MYKIIFADVDGTVRNSRREISQRTKDDIKKLTQSGMIVVLCSGRPRCDLEKISRECGASRYIISSNGAEIYNYIEKKVEYRDLIDYESTKRLFEIAKEKDCTFVMNTGSIRIVNKTKYKDLPERVIPNEEILKAVEENAILQCTIVDTDMEKIESIIEEVENNFDRVKVVNRSKVLKGKEEQRVENIYCDVVDNTVSKASAAKKLCEILEIDQEETAGIGDGYNDMELLEFVHYSAAMANSIRGIKSKVNYVTENNDVDGAAIFFERMLNNEIK